MIVCLFAKMVIILILTYRETLTEWDYVFLTQTKVEKSMLSHKNEIIYKKHKNHTKVSKKNFFTQKRSFFPLESGTCPIQFYL